MAKNAEREEGRRTWTDEHMQTHGGRVSSRNKQTGSVWGSLCTSSAHYNSLKHLQRKVWRSHVEGLSWKKTTGRAASLPTIKPFTFIQNVDFITISLLICVQLKPQKPALCPTRADGSSEPGAPAVLKETLWCWGQKHEEDKHTAAGWCVFCSVLLSDELHRTTSQLDEKLFVTLLISRTSQTEGV